ncbi:hypothetical protein Pfo_027442 [Paulownia fortunei]|nr:hypothetical protein Pfo_027442 [Paulownia fortunei]
MYLCLYHTSSRIYMSRYVKFFKSIFPFDFLQSTLLHPSIDTMSHWCPIVSPLPIILLSNIDQPALAHIALLPFTELLAISLSSCAAAPENLSHWPNPPSIPEPISSFTTSPHAIITCSKNNIFKHIQKLNLTAQLLTPSNLEPSPSHDPKWCQVMSDEYNALVQNGT